MILSARHHTLGWSLISWCTETEFEETDWSGDNGRRIVAGNWSRVSLHVAATNWSAYRVLFHQKWFLPLDRTALCGYQPHPANTKETIAKTKASGINFIFSLLTNKISNDLLLIWTVKKAKRITELEGIRQNCRIIVILLFFFASAWLLFHIPVFIRLGTLPHQPKENMLPDSATKIPRWNHAGGIWAFTMVTGTSYLSWSFLDFSASSSAFKFSKTFFKLAAGSASASSPPSEPLRVPNILRASSAARLLG